MASQTEKIEEFLIEMTNTPEYSAVEYLVFSIRKQPNLYYLSEQRLRGFEMPAFLRPLAECIKQRFQLSGITVDIMLQYMLANDINNWVHYYMAVSISNSTTTGEKVQCNEKLFYLILTGFILDTFKVTTVDIRTIAEGELLEHEHNKYGLTKVRGIQFKRDSFIYDGKAYLYNIMTNISTLNFADTMPGFARVITENVNDGDILLRVDERLALPAEQIITYSTINFEKYRGPQLHFEGNDFDDEKAITVHMNYTTGNKLLMVRKCATDSTNQKDIVHIEIETLPHYESSEMQNQCITIFLHGIYHPCDGCFTHIDYARNQYERIDYKKKYEDATPEVPIDYYAQKKLHYKIWCIENGYYSKETWYQLMRVSLPEEYGNLLVEMLQ